jgi:MFS family permease
VLTQFLQFSLGYSPLAAGVRVLPAAMAIVVIAPLSAVGVRLIGPKLTMVAGLAFITAGLYLVSGITASTGYGGIVAGMVLLGAGAGLALPTSSGSVVGSVSRQHAGVASATNTTANQVGGALGVAVIGSLLTTRYSGHITAALAGQHLPAAADLPVPHGPNACCCDVSFHHDPGRSAALQRHLQAGSAGARDRSWRHPKRASGYCD